MKDTASESVRTLLDVLIGHGLDTIVLSPGSRNTPLLIAAEARTSLSKIVIPDERTAAFFAMGIARVTGRPVALACTSGTALYNYAPAVAEAYYQKIPLIVITADRPACWIDQDDSQTLRQSGALDHIVKRSFDIPVDSVGVRKAANPEMRSERHWFVNRTANEAYNCTVTGQPGPVHINIQLDSPLGEIIDIRPQDERIITQVPPSTAMTGDQALEIARELEGKRVLVAAGFMGYDERLDNALRKFMSFPEAGIMAEVVSNLHLQADAYEIDSMLSCLTETERDEIRPDIVISIGGALVSRKLKEFIRRSEGTEHWKLGDSGDSSDCFQRCTRYFDSAPSEFFERIGDALVSLHGQKKDDAGEGGYREILHGLRERTDRINADFCRELPWSEFSALRTVFENLPEQSTVFLSNGTPIRYAQLFIKSLPERCIGNRGVSGIEGTNATAAGVAFATDSDTILVTGDLSFSYCPQILALKQLCERLKIIVVNNGGGGIFRFIPQTRDLRIREEYLCAAPLLPLEKLADAYGWKYLRAESGSELETALKEFLAMRHSLLEIRADGQLSAEILRRYLDRR